MRAKLFLTAGISLSHVTLVLSIHHILHTMMEKVLSMQELQEDLKHILKKAN